MQFSKVQNESLDKTSRGTWQSFQKRPQLESKRTKNNVSIMCEDTAFIWFDCGFHILDEFCLQGFFVASLTFSQVSFAPFFTFSNVSEAFCLKSLVASVHKVESRCALSSYRQDFDSWSRAKQRVWDLHGRLHTWSLQSQRLQPCPALHFVCLVDLLVTRIKICLYASL